MNERHEMLLELAVSEALEREPRPLTASERLTLDPVYVSARDDFESVVSLLGSGAPPVAPPSEMKNRLMARIADESTSESRSRDDAADLPAGGFRVKPGVTGVRTGEVTWEKTPIKGTDMKVIHRDTGRGYTTRLVRIATGGGYPYHRHGGTEEIFMLEGSVWVNGTLLKAGDYCRSEAGTDERGTYSEDGALAIVISSDADDIALEDVPSAD